MVVYVEIPKSYFEMLLEVVYEFISKTKDKNQASPISIYHQ